MDILIDIQMISSLSAHIHFHSHSQESSSPDIKFGKGDQVGGSMKSSQSSSNNSLFSFSAPTKDEVSETENEISPRIESSKDEEESDNKSESTVEATTESKNGKRRGVWRRIRVRPLDTFEAAESQHVSQPAYNVLPSDFSRNKFESKGTYNSFTKNFLGKPDAEENETASPLVMEKEPEIVTEVEEEVVGNTENPEYKIDATKDDDKEALFESTTILPETPETTVSTSTNSPVTGAQTSVGTTENIYDEVRKSLSDLFSRAPEEEQDATVVPEVAEDKDEEDVEDSEEEMPKEPTIPEEDVPLVSQDEKKDDEEEKEEVVEEEPVTELAQVIELPAEPEVKANVTEINRTYVITSTSQQVSHETEICYRGKCIKTIEPKK